MIDREPGDEIELVTGLVLAHAPDALPAATVREQVREEFAAFDGARIHDYVAVFVERRMRVHLRDAR